MAFNNKMVSLNNTAKENIEKNIYRTTHENGYWRIKENEKIRSKFISPDIVTAIKVTMIYD
jgi:hypothetical protein